MGAQARKPSQRAVARGDIVTLQFIGPGTSNIPDKDIVISNERLRLPHSWESSLVGRLQGDTLVLPEAEKNEVHAVILNITSA